MLSKSLEGRQRLRPDTRSARKAAKSAPRNEADAFGAAVKRSGCDRRQSYGGRLDELRHLIEVRARSGGLVAVSRLRGHDAVAAVAFCWHCASGAEAGERRAQNNEAWKARATSAYSF
jgi:hypothetical protein